MDKAMEFLSLLVMDTASQKIWLLRSCAWFSNVVLYWLKLYEVMALLWWNSDDETFRFINTIWHCKTLNGRCSRFYLNIMHDIISPNSMNIFWSKESRLKVSCFMAECGINKSSEKFERNKKTKAGLECQFSIHRTGDRSEPFTMNLLINQNVNLKFTAK